MKRVSPNNTTCCDNVHIPAKEKVFMYLVEKYESWNWHLGKSIVYFFQSEEKIWILLHYLVQLFPPISYRESGEIYSCSVNSTKTAI